LAGRARFQGSRLSSTSRTSAPAQARCTGPRIRLHFTPTLVSWLNLVEVFFAIIDRQALRRGDFTSLEALIGAIGRFRDGWNQRCKPFTWTKPADELLAKLSRQALQRRTTRDGMRTGYDSQIQLP
jgi:hypothetical protein